MYYLSFIDDFSRNTWIYFLKKKFEVFDWFKEFKALVENQTEKKIKVLRIDNGGAFCSKEFEEFCKKGGISWSPSSTLEDKTPQKVWTGKKPSLSHLRVFGCDAYVHVPKEKRTKLDSKSEKCIFIGYKDGLKGYKLWNPVTRKVVYNRDVVFREVKDVIKHEVQPKEPEKREFELKEEESDSTAEEESEDEEPQTLAGYKLCNPATRKVVYSRDVVLREVKDVIKHEVQRKEPEKIEFELKKEESESTAEEESEDEEPQTSAVRRLVRERRHHERYSPSAFCSNFSLSITDDDPKTVKEAVDLEDGKLWKEAMVDEMASLHKNEAWDLVQFPTRRKPIGSKWVLRKKTNEEGKVEKYKARLVVQSYSQMTGIDFGDIFSPIAKVTSIRLLLSVVVAFDFEEE
eukprot:PITA_29314